MAGNLNAATQDVTSAKPIWQMGRLLCPSFKQLLGGELEAVGMLMINLVRVVEIRLQTHITMIMERALNSRSVAGFKDGLLKGTAVAFAATALGMLYGLLQSRLTWKWKNKMTKILHDKYFDGMNYYLIGAGAATFYPLPDVFGCAVFSPTCENSTLHRLSSITAFSSCSAQAAPRSRATGWKTPMSVSQTT